LDLEQLRSSGASLHRKLFLRMLSNAAGLPPDQLVFHDYGLPDNVAFRLADGLPEDPDLMRSCAAFRYWKVFLLAPVPFVRDGIRMEDEAYQHQLAALLPGVYESLGYAPISVPLESVHNRCQQILSVVSA